jgi:hypothetical protein
MARTAVIRCPACGVETEEVMPTDACRYFWDCPACTTVVRPRPGDCCVFCSYGSAMCPPAIAEDAVRHEARPPGGPSLER